MFRRLRQTGDGALPFRFRLDLFIVITQKQRPLPLPQIVNEQVIGDSSQPGPSPSPFLSHIIKSFSFESMGLPVSSDERLLYEIEFLIIIEQPIRHFADDPKNIIPMPIVKFGKSLA